MTATRLLCTQPLDPSLRGLPPRGTEDFLGTLEDLLAYARRSVQIVCPFIDAKGADVLAEAWGRANSQARWEIYTRRAPSRLSTLARRAGWLVYEYVGTPGGDQKRGFHCKLFIADGERAIIGSVNLIYQNLVENLEVGVLLEEQDDVRPLLAIPRALRRASRKIP